MTETDYSFLDLLKPEPMARELGWSRRKLDRLHLRGKGPPRIQIGRTVWYRRSSVLMWLANQERERGRRKVTS